MAWAWGVGVAPGWGRPDGGDQRVAVPGDVAERRPDPGDDRRRLCGGGQDR
ncbi:MAG: hypothetical protein JWR45_2603 [Blastococcus sp.]|jgi:hypothetical protein|nr:hypothetical protein [Blastococcus sp.]